MGELLTISFYHLGILCFGVAILSLGLFFIFDEDELLSSWYYAGGMGLICLFLNALSIVIGG